MQSKVEQSQDHDPEISDPFPPQGPVTALGTQVQPGCLFPGECSGDRCPSPSCPPPDQPLPTAPHWPTVFLMSAQTHPADPTPVSLIPATDPVLSRLVPPSGPKQQVTFMTHHSKEGPYCPHMIGRETEAFPKVTQLASGGSGFKFRLTPLPQTHLLRPLQRAPPSAVDSLHRVTLTPACPSSSPWPSPGRPPTAIARLPPHWAGLGFQQPPIRTVPTSAARVVYITPSPTHTHQGAAQTLRARPSCPPGSPHPSPRALSECCSSARLFTSPGSSVALLSPQHTLLSLGTGLHLSLLRSLF